MISLATDQESLSAREIQHRHFGGEVRPEDFYSAEYYDPSLHLQHLLEDWDFDIELEWKFHRMEADG